MNKYTFDWIDDFETLNNIYANIYVDDELKAEKVFFNQILVYKNEDYNLIVKLDLDIEAWNNIVKEKNILNNNKIQIEIVSPMYIEYKDIILYKAKYNNSKMNPYSKNIELSVKVKKIEYISKIEETILKEWYGSFNGLDFINSVPLQRQYEESTTYKYGNKKVFQLKMITTSNNCNYFWVKLKEFKFKVSIDEIRNKENTYHNYTIEYRKEWSMIPSDSIRRDISQFLSFIIGTELIKFGETGFTSEYAVRKMYTTPSILEHSSLFQYNQKFFVESFEGSNTEDVIKQISKMLKNYFKYKEQYRLNEVFASLYIHSYLNFNFINYVTLIEMFSNIYQDSKKNKTVVNKTKFRNILKKLNSLKGIPKEIKDKFNNLNMIGIGKKVKKLLAKQRIDYDRYKEVFDIRGAVVHGNSVDIEKMYLASQKAKELLTILTLKQLKYSGYIRNFIKNDEVIFLEDFKIKNINTLKN